LSSLDMCDGFVAVCRFDQGAAVEGAGVGFLKNLVLNILFHSSKCRLKAEYRFRRHFGGWVFKPTYAY
ncbi:hypothetical protein, partial [Neisseria meningitidis]|uniref:hypothetical protein n=6 Tax=Neisseria meningitidis TaxID=487 RepID=UPI0028FC2314